MRWRAILLFFFFCSSGKGSVLDSCLLALEKLTPFHLVTTGATIANRLSPRTASYRSGNLVSLLHGARDEKNVSPLPIKIVSSLEISSEKQLLTDNEGRTYLVEHGEPTHQFVYVTPSGRSIRFASGRSLPLSPLKDLTLREQSNELAMLLLKTNPSTADKRRIKELRTPEMAAALEDGAEVSVPSIPGYEQGGRGRLTVGKSGDLFLSMETPRHYVDVTDETGRRVRVPSDRWKAMVADHEPTRMAGGPQATARSHAMIANRETHERNVEKTRDTFKFVPKVLFYPYVLPYRAIRAMRTKKDFNGTPIRQSRPLVFVRDGVAIAGYLFMTGTATHPAYYFLRAALEDEPLFWKDYLEETNKEMGPKPDGVTLVVDAIPQSDKLHGAASVYFQKRYRDDPYAFHATVNNVEELLEAIKGAENIAGKKVARLEVFAHGNMLSNGEQSTSVLEIGMDTLTPNPKLAKEIIDDYFARGKALAERVGIKFPEPTNRYVDLRSVPQMSEYFVDGAQIRLTSCLVGKGEAGEQYLRILGDKTVAKKGGKIAAATLAVELPSEILTPRAREQIELEKIAREMVRQEIEKEQAKIPLSERVANQATNEVLWHALLPVTMAIGAAMHDFSPEDEVKVIHFPKPEGAMAKFPQELSVPAGGAGH